MKRNLPVLVLALLLSAGSIVAGNMYWNHKKVGFFQKLYTRKSFTLLDGEGKIFDTKDFPKNKKILVVFTPDSIPTAAVKPFRFLMRDLAKHQGDGIYVVVASRVHEDIVRNFLRASRFQGKVLFDPSGALGRYLGVWSNMELVNDWTFALVSSELAMQWAVTKSVIPAYKELGSKL